MTITLTARTTATNLYCMVLETPMSGSPPRQSCGYFYARNLPGRVLYGRGWPEYNTGNGNTSGALIALSSPWPPESFRLHDMEVVMTNAYALQVRGNSMHPVIRDGWIVTVEPAREPQVGEFAVIQCTDGRNMIKEFLGWRGDELILQSVNDEQGRLTLHRSDVKAIHAVGGILPPSRRRVAVRKMPVIVPWRLPRWRHMRNRNQM